MPCIFINATEQQIKCTMDCKMLADLPPVKCQTKKPSVNKQRRHLSGVLSNLLIHELIPPLRTLDCQGKWSLLVFHLNSLGRQKVTTPGPHSTCIIWVMKPALRLQSYWLLKNFLKVLAKTLSACVKAFQTKPLPFDIRGGGKKSSKSPTSVVFLGL